MSDAEWREPLETLLTLFVEYEAGVVRSVLALERTEDAVEQIATMAFWGGMGSLLDVPLSSMAKGKSEVQICDEIAQALAFRNLAQWLTRVRGPGLWTVREQLMEKVILYWQGRRG